VTVKCRTAIKVLFLFLNLCLSVKLDSHSVSCTSISFLINPLQKMFLRFFFVIYRLLKRDKSCQLMLLEYRTITEKGNSHFSVEAKMLPPLPFSLKQKCTVITVAQCAPLLALKICRKMWFPGLKKEWNILFLFIMHTPLAK
jgi:hypothetical protein